MGREKEVTMVARPWATRTLAISVPAILLVVTTWMFFSNSRLKEPVPIPELPAPIQVPRGDLQSMFRDHVQPLLEASGEGSRESAARCTQRIHDHFETYRQHIGVFVDDITSTWTRLGILRRMPADWWQKENRVEEFVQKKFEKHIFSEGKLNDDITTALVALRDDLRADRALLLSRVKLAVSESEFPDVEIPSNIDFDVEVNQLLHRFASRRATDTVYQGLATLVTSEVAALAATSIVARVVTALGTSAATSAAAAGGATAGGAAAGAGGGSLGGPVGTAIGLGIGVVVGIAVDWWMTDRFRDQMKTELQLYLFRLESGILRGAHDQTGLEADLERLVEDINRAQREVLTRKLIGENTL